MVSVCNLEICFNLTDSLALQTYRQTIEAYLWSRWLVVYISLLHFFKIELRLVHKNINSFTFYLMPDMRENFFFNSRGVKFKNHAKIQSNIRNP